VSRIPFVLLGPAHNLKYLRSYGFRTFGDFWDEGYDDIEDPILRMQSIGLLLESICQHTLPELERTLAQMQEVLDYNYNLFYSQEFIDGCWSELTLGLSNVCEQQPVVPGLPEAIARYLASRP